MYVHSIVISKILITLLARFVVHVITGENFSIWPPFTNTCTSYSSTHAVVFSRICPRILLSYKWAECFFLIVSQAWKGLDFSLFLVHLFLTPPLTLRVWSIVYRIDLMKVILIETFFVNGEVTFNSTSPFSAWFANEPLSLLKYLALIVLKLWHWFFFVCG